MTLYPVRSKYVFLLCALIVAMLGFVNVRSVHAVVPAGRAVSRQDAGLPGQAAPQAPVADTVQLLDQIGGALTAVYVFGDYAYVGEGPRLIIFDVRNPAAPVLAGRSPVLQGLVEDVIVQGDYAYVADGYGGLQILDVSSPATPRIISSANAVGKAYSIVLVGSTVFQVDSAGLRLFDVTDPADPTPLGYFNTATSVYDVYVVGTVAYLGEQGGLRLLDVSNQISPTQLGFYGTAGNVTAVYVAGTTAFAGVSGADSGLHLIDVATPATPTLISKVASYHGAALDVVVVGGIAYVAEGDSYFDPGLHMIDVSNASDPKNLTEYAGGWAPTRLAVANQHVFLVDSGEGFGTRGFVIVDIDTPSGALEVGRYNGLGKPDRVFGASGRVFATDKEQISALDVTNPTRAEIVDVLKLTQVRDGIVHDDLIYLAFEFVQFLDWSDWQLRILDAAALSSVGLFDNGDGGYEGGGVAVVGDRAYVTLARTDEDTDFIVLDVSDPANPTEINRMTLPDVTWRLVARDGIAYVAGDTNGLHIVSVPYNGAPTLLKTYNTGAALKDVALLDNLAFLADSADGIRVLDIASPADPQAVEWFDTPSSATALHVQPTLAFVTDRDSGLRVLDISEPTNISERTFFNTPGQAQDLYVDENNVIYVADGDGGLLLLRYPPCYPLTRTADGSGAVPMATPWASPGCPGGQYIAGATVALTAAPAAGWRVDHWAGTVSDDRFEAQNQVIMPAAPHTVAVTYAPLPQLDFAQSDYTVDEIAAQVQVTLTLTSSSVLPVRVRVTSADGTATAGQDYTALTGDVTIPAGATFYAITVILQDDDEPEENETLTLHLSAPVSATLGMTTTTITIVDDDAVASGDGYEPDDSCTTFSPIGSDGIPQQHTFHTAEDADWVRFDAAAGVTYIVEATTSDTSSADVTLEVYAGCDAVPLSQGYPFSPDVRMTFEAVNNGPIYLRLTDAADAAPGETASYALSVRALNQGESPGALILVAGRLKSNDSVAANIHYVTDAVYQLFVDNGYSHEQIYYLAPDKSHSPNVDALATHDNLRNAVTEWAVNRVGPGRALTLYIVDHGDRELFYLDKPNRQWVTPGELDAWLDVVEEQHDGLNVNVVIEACYSGSFISAGNGVSKPGRVIITSTDEDNLAWASENGAVFSDHFLDGLRRGESLYSSYTDGSKAAVAFHPSQRAWLDGDGDGNALDDGSQTVAAQRGFAFAGTLIGEVWPPYIAEVVAPSTFEEGRGLIKARVLDDVRPDNVWAVIYGPDYTEPSGGDELVQDALPTVRLLKQSDDWYAAYHDGFRTPGVYRVVIYAEDDIDMNALPRAFSVTVAGAEGDVIYLPWIVR